MTIIWRWFWIKMTEVAQKENKNFKNIIILDCTSIILFYMFWTKYIILFRIFCGKFIYIGSAIVREKFLDPRKNDGFALLPNTTDIIIIHRFSEHSIPSSYIGVRNNVNYFAKYAIFPILVPISTSSFSIVIFQQFQLHYPIYIFPDANVIA